MSNDFESIVGWAPENKSLTTERAHSGRYSLKVDKDTEFSLTYDVLLGKLSAKRLRGVKLEAWAYLPNAGGDAKLGLVINAPNSEQTILGEGIQLGEQVKKYNEWVKVSKDIVFPPNAEYMSHMKIFLWRAGASAPAYIDDITLTPLD
ncbi:hypothetical protein GCM10023186_16300 [Hymenobacter koreensis]|uniref:CBM-cenC domain-containing protein n=2 Tax=Hymenobacter koreensis TaxID=1084523 RepID=A0ABP8IXU1_9BACT